MFNIYIELWEKVNKIIQQGKEAETIDKMKRQAQRRTQWER